MANGRLTLTLRRGDSVEIVSPVGPVEVRLTEATDQRAALHVEAAPLFEVAWDLGRMPAPCDLEIFARGAAYVEPPGESDRIEIYVSKVAYGHVTIAFGAPKAWKISRKTR